MVGGGTFSLLLDEHSPNLLCLTLLNNFISSEIHQTRLSGPHCEGKEK